MDGTHTQLDENNATIFILIRVSFYPCFHYPWLFSQAFPMDGTHTQLDENNATIFILIRVSFYPCFHYPWLFSQAM